MVTNVSPNQTRNTLHAYQSSSLDVSMVSSSS